MWLGSGVAVAVTEDGSCSSNSTPSLGTSICHGCIPPYPRQKKRFLTDKLKEAETVLTDLEDKLKGTKEVHKDCWTRNCLT